MNAATRVFLSKNHFGESEKTLVESGDLSASVFRYSTGVAAVRIKNSRGEIVVLPYQGQQVWRCSFDGKPLTMKSVFDEPVPSTVYLETYGGFLLHCGVTGMGVPGDKDTHPLHGELPNARYENAYLEIGGAGADYPGGASDSDGAGPYIAIGGCYHHRIAFNTFYRAEPRIALRAGASTIDASMRISNLLSVEMELMYMMHINFLPIDQGELVYSAEASPDTVRVFVSVPTHMRSGGGIEALKSYLELLSEHPERHHVLKPEQPYDPEVVFSITYRADDEGWAHSMMVYPDGAAAYVSHRPESLPFGIRWIARTGDQEALGLVLPATAEHKGYGAEKAKGNIQTIGAGESVEFCVKAGLLDSERVQAVRRKIAEILR